MTREGAAELLRQARFGESDLERKLAASILIARGVFPFPTTPTTTPTSGAVAAAGGSTMQQSGFKKATKKQAKLRLTLDGPAGSGKTYSGLSLASKYANLFEFDSVELEEFSIETYLRTIEMAKGAGYDILIIDSLSHAWTGKGGALEQVDRVGGTNKFANGWRQVTPLHNRLVDAILAYPGHVICTMRTKTEYLVEDVNGKKVPRKVGMAPVQRDGMEYEFDVVADLSVDGNLTVSKTRCPELSGTQGLLRREDVDIIAEKLKTWLTDGASPQVVPAPAPTPPAANGNAEPARAVVQPPQQESFPSQPVSARQPQMSKVEQVIALLDEAASKADMDRIAPRIKKELTKAEQDRVRPHWARNSQRISGKGANNG
jgi:hypothetical protein